MGPFELMDLIGIDINYSVTCSVWEAYAMEPRFAPHALQKQMVEVKRYGRKVKRGFYKYD
jgi:3-hydroxybutyryl-CoA dehydrogenase